MPRLGCCRGSRGPHLRSGGDVVRHLRQTLTMTQAALEQTVIA